MSLRWSILIILLLVVPSIAEARGERSTQEVPFAITSITGEELSSSGISDLSKINNYGALPASTITNRGFNNPQITIRGIGSSQSQSIVDGTPLRAAPGAGNFPLFDIDQVEVLKGPQGTLYGRRAVNIVVPKIIRGDLSNHLPNLDNLETHYPGSSAAYDTYHAYFNTGDGPNNYNPFFDTDLARSMFSGDLAFAANQYNRWGQTYSGLTFDDLYFFKKGGSQPTGPRLWPTAYLYEPNKWVEYKDADYPNDPLYPKKGSSGKASTARKALGSLLGMVGSSLNLSKDEASAQWGLIETGFRRKDGAESAWDVAAGDHENVVVAVIDSGLDLTHIDGPRYVWTNSDEIAGNGIDDDSNGYVDDIHGWNFYSETNNITDDSGHGTFVAGIIAAKTNNGEGMAGINPGARIMPLKVLNREGKSRILAVYRAIRYAVDNGARVINLSLGGEGITRLEQIGINYAYAMGCIVVVAAGNEDGDIAHHGPPGARRAFSVAAMDMDGNPRESSNHGLNVAVIAPGQSIYSLTAKEGNRDGKFMPVVAGKYFRSSGTSFSAPFVTGTASLIWSKYPDLSNRMVEDMILQSAKDIQDQGWDPYTGYGLLDAHGALTQNPRELLVPRVTEVFLNKEKNRIASVDLYGVIRGNLDHYMVSMGRGSDPKKWQIVYGPATTPVDFQLISRIDGVHFAKGSQWTVRVDAVDRQQQTKSIKILISKDTG